MNRHNNKLTGASESPHQATVIAAGVGNYQNSIYDNTLCYLNCLSLSLELLYGK